MTNQQQNPDENKPAWRNKRRPPVKDAEAGQIAALVKTGYTNREIAKMMGRNRQTINRIHRKLKISNPNMVDAVVDEELTKITPIAPIIISNTMLQQKDPELAWKAASRHLAGRGYYTETQKVETLASKSTEELLQMLSESLNSLASQLAGKPKLTPIDADDAEYSVSNGEPSDEGQDSESSDDSEQKPVNP